MRKYLSVLFGLLSVAAVAAPTANEDYVDRRDAQTYTNAVNAAKAYSDGKLVEAKSYTDASIAQAGSVSLSMVTNVSSSVTSNVVTKAYVESLGIETGIDTNAVRVIVAAATNAVPRITDGQNEITANGDTYIESPLGEWTPSHSPIPENPMDGDEYYYDIFFDIHDDEEQIGTWLCGIRRYYEGEWHDYDSASLSDDDASGNITAFTFPGGTPTRRLLRTRLATTNDVSSSSAQTLASALSSLSAATNGLATAATVSALSSQVSTIGAHLNAEDARFVVTNYNSVTHTPEAYVEIKLPDQSWSLIWSEMTRWNYLFNNYLPTNYYTKGHVDTALSQKADRAWGAYDSETGAYAPDDYTWISSKKIAIAANLAYQRTITTEGAIWVLESNGTVTETGGLTNGFFRISDDEGNALFEIVKGSKRTVGADASSCQVVGAFTPTKLQIGYSVVSDVHPTLYVCNSLSTQLWKAETDADCLANVVWSGSSGAWVAQVQGKTAQTALFVKAEYEVGGETYISNTAPVSMQYLMLNGVKYAVGTATISGNTVLTLTVAQ